MIFDNILACATPRNQIIAPTQYGKSLTVAVAVLCRAVAMGEKFTILAPTEKKAGIIMGYLIDHIFDDDMFLYSLELDSGTSLDRLRRERSRNTLTFKGGGGVKTLTLDAKSGRKAIEAAMGFGGNRIILDESSLVPDVLYATVKRMLGGYPIQDQYLLEIGNPFYRNHFLRTWSAPNYTHLFIDYKTGLEEGRYSPEFIDEMRGEALFDILYECKFPTELEMDERGYRPLFTYEMIEGAYVDNIELDPKPKLELGGDIGAGGDYNAYSIKSKNAWIVEKGERKQVEAIWIDDYNQVKDTMSNVTKVEDYLDKYKTLEARDVSLDDTGVGKGVTDRLHEKGKNVNAVTLGAKAVNTMRFVNVRAEAYWGFAEWIKAGGKLKRDARWLQLTDVKYKVNTDRVIQIEPKSELIKRTGKSPDFADSGMLTFAAKAPEPRLEFI